VGGRYTIATVDIAANLARLSTTAREAVPLGASMDRLDLIDRKIVAELMRDASQPIAQIAERVGLSQTPCWKRIQRLESAGVITGRVALVDQARVGLGLTVFVGVEAPDHSSEWRLAFSDAVAAIPEIVEVFRMAGEMDYLLRIVVADMAAFDALYRRLTDAVPLKNVTSHFAMERVKATSVYPIDTQSR
jgi:Lrp/AsnC family transcriptional regulator